MTCYFHSHFTGQSKLQQHVSLQWGTECNFLMCLKAREPEILVSSIDVYHKKGLPILNVRNLRFRDINNLGKITLYLCDILECKIPKSIFFPLQHLASHIFTITLVSMSHTEQTYFLLTSK